MMAKNVVFLCNQGAGPTHARFYNQIKKIIGKVWDSWIHIWWLFYDRSYIVTKIYYFVYRRMH